MKNNRYFYVEKALGSLREVQVRGINLDNTCISDKQFAAIDTTVSVWSHYGQYNENRLQILQNGTESPIIIKGVEFWPVIKDVFYFQVSTDANNYHELTISGKFENGVIFEDTFCVRGSEALPGIIYIMVLIAETSNVELAKEYWNALTRGVGLKYNSMGEHLDKVINLKKLSDRILGVYPYMTILLQKGLESVVANLKTSLDSLILIKD